MPLWPPVSFYRLWRRCLIKHGDRCYTWSSEKAGPKWSHNNHQDKTHQNYVLLILLKDENISSPTLKCTCYHNAICCGLVLVQLSLSSTCNFVSGFSWVASTVHARWDNSQRVAGRVIGVPFPMSKSAMTENKVSTILFPITRPKMKGRVSVCERDDSRGKMSLASQVHGGSPLGGVVTFR